MSKKIDEGKADAPKEPQGDAQGAEQAQAAARPKPEAMSEKAMNDELMRPKEAPRSLDIDELSKAAKDNELDSLIQLVGGQITGIAEGPEGSKMLLVKTEFGEYSLEFLVEPMGKPGFAQVTDLDQ